MDERVLKNIAETNDVESVTKILGTRKIRT